MSLADTVARCRSGVFQLAFVNSARQKLGGGTGFLSHGHLITNHHVFLGYRDAVEVGLRRDDMPIGEFRPFPSQDFGGWLVSGSEQHSYDYAILRAPAELLQPSDHQFIME